MAFSCPLPSSHWVAERFWHHNFGKISAFWALAFLIPFTVLFGWQLSLYEALHTFLLEYLPFIILLFSLFTVAGGVRLRGKLRGTPMVNTGLLLVGTIIASWTGTTGAAMLLIRPVLRANEWRTHKVHVVVFFIFLVANIGGSLTPLGDPPPFLGFLKGVDFFWPTKAMFLPMLMVLGNPAGGVFPAGQLVLPPGGRGLGRGPRRGAGGHPH